MEGQKLNIPSYVQDTNYRYQMPVMKLKIEGRGKNIRTNIENMVDISKALNVNTECKTNIFSLSFFLHKSNILLGIKFIVTFTYETKFLYLCLIDNKKPLT
jgi:hypothetical protein